MAQSGKILITGAAGFVGKALCRKLRNQGYALRVVVRRGGSYLPEDLIRDLDDVVEVEDFMDEASWANLLIGVDRVVHLAARAHAGGQSGAADFYFRDNLDMTVALGRAALRARVKKFIFLSTIKVNGEGVLKPDHRPYKSADQPRPRGAYAISKWRAEQDLNALFSNSETSELVILRPPMIYGEAVKGNSAFLQKWLALGLPLPVPKAGNRRSLLAIEHLLDKVTELLFDTAKTNCRLLLPCDSEDWSTQRLAGCLVEKKGRQVRTLTIPDLLVKISVIIFRCEVFFTKFFGSLRVENQNSFVSQDKLDW